MVNVLMQTNYGGGTGGGGGGDPVAAVAGLVLFALIIFAMVALWGMIFKKAGYSFWMGILMLIPLVNIIWLLIFAFSTWPIHRELERYQMQVGYSGGGFPVGGSQPPPPPVPAR